MVFPSRRTPFATAAVLLTLGPSLRAQEPPQTFPASTELVRLDLVALDKAGGRVMDLKAREIEVLEDGVLCPVEAFRLVEPGAPAAALGLPAGSSAPAASGPDMAGREALIVLVFDRLSPESAAQARAAATAFVKRPFPAGTWLAVLEIGSRSRLTSSFSQDGARWPEAVAAATSGGERRELARGETDATLTREALNAALVAAHDSTGVQGIDPVAAAKIRQPSSFSETKQREVEARVLTELDALDRQRLGSDSLYALLALARAMTGVEGRKSVLYFAEGLPVPSAVSEALDLVVSQANRANLTVYAVDTRGLLTEGGNEESNRALIAARNLSERAMRSAGAEDGPTRGVSPMEVKAHDLALDSIRLNAKANLRDLAEATGGFLVSDTNDLATGLERIGGDLRGYYEVGYTPANPGATGAFREIEVRVRRRGVTVRTRRGYFAFPPGQSAALPYELALANALAEREPPHAFALSVTSTPEVANGGAARIEVTVPLNELRIDSDDAKGAYRAHLSLLVLVKDADGAVAAKLSHDWPIRGPLSDLARARAQSATVRRDLNLPPGRYVLEAAAMDRLGGTRSTQRSELAIER